MEDKRFAAALKGIDLGPDPAQERFEEVRRRAEAKALGLSEEVYSLDGYFGVFHIHVKLPPRTLNRHLPIVNKELRY